MAKNTTAVKKEEPQKQITSLTKEQQDKIPEYLERFRAIGLSTAPTNKQKAEDAVRRAYIYLNKENKDFDVTKLEFVWADSPMKGAIIAAQSAKGDINVTDAEVQAQASLASYGSFEAYWASTYVFIAEQLDVKKDELVHIVLDIITECGVYWTFDDLVVMTPKPSKISMRDQKLHDVDGPALAYPNGDGIYAVNGVRKNSLMEVVISARNADTAAPTEGDQE